MSLYSDTLAAYSYRFKRLMLTYTDTEIEQTLRNARLLFEKLDKILDAPNEATEAYRSNIEKLVAAYKAEKDIASLITELKQQESKLNQLL